MKLLFIWAFCCLPLLLYAQEPKFINLFSTELSKNVACYRIPAIITAKNGDLVAMVDERVPSCGDLKWNKDINIVMRRSADNGQTWTQIETVINYPYGESASDPSLLLDSQTGELFMFFNYMNLATEHDVYYLKVSKSQDHGKSWSEPEDITKQITKVEWKEDFKFITSGRGIQTNNGDLMHSLVNLERGLHLFKSSDHGQSWQLIDHPLKPGDESKVVELSDGTLMVNSRVNGLGTRYVHRSTDHGQTWTSTADQQLTDPACNASILRYQYREYDLLLFSNANSSNTRENLTIKYSKDNGQSWNTGKTIYAGAAAYSSMTLMKNGDIGILFEKDEYQENVFVSIPIAYLLEH